MVAHQLEVDHFARQLGLDLGHLAPAGSRSRGDVAHHATGLVDRDRVRAASEFATAGISLLRLLRQRSGDDRVECGRQVGPFLTGCGRLCVEVSEQHGQLRLTPMTAERGVPDKTLEEHAPERIHVGHRVDLAAGDLLRRDVVDGAHQSSVAAGALVGDALGEPEVRQIDVVGAVRAGAAVEQDVRRLHVAMHQTACRAPRPARSRPGRRSRSRPPDPCGRPARAASGHLPRRTAWR